MLHPRPHSCFIHQHLMYVPIWRYTCSQTAVTFFLSAWFVLLIARAPPVWARLMASARPRWDALEVGWGGWVVEVVGVVGRY